MQAEFAAFREQRPSNVGATQQIGGSLETVWQRQQQNQVREVRARALQAAAPHPCCSASSALEAACAAAAAEAEGMHTTAAAEALAAVAAGADTGEAAAAGGLAGGGVSWQPCGNVPPPLLSLDAAAGKAAAKLGWEAEAVGTVCVFPGRAVSYHTAAGTFPLAWAHFHCHACGESRDALPLELGSLGPTAQMPVQVFDLQVLQQFDTLQAGAGVGGEAFQQACRSAAGWGVPWAVPPTFDDM